MKNRSRTEARAARVHTATKPASAESVDMRTLTLQALLAFGCVFCVSYLGFGEFAISSSAAIAFGPLAGILAALACRRWWLAGAAAGLGVVAGTILGATFPALDPGTYATPSVVMAMAAAATVAGAAFTWLVSRRPHLERYIAWFGVALAILAVCLYAWQGATAVRSRDVTAAELYAATPAMGPETSDVEVFVLTIRRMEAGESYYSAFGRTLTERAQASAGSSLVRGINLRNATAFRFPTLYWFLTALPNGWQSWVLAMLALIGAATVAAWSIAARYVHPAVALSGTAITVIYLGGFCSFTLPFSEPWAGALGLVAVALALKSLSVRRMALAWASAAAGVALLATFTRELAVAFVLVGLISTLVAERARSRHLWFPWALALTIAAIGYFAHVQAATTAALIFSPPVGGSRLSYFDPTGRGLAADLYLAAIFTWWTASSAWVVWALGTVGGVLAPRDWPRRVLLGSVTIGGAIALFMLHPNALSGEMIPGYWGYVVLPSVFACAPLALSRLPWTTRTIRGA